LLVLLGATLRFKVSGTFLKIWHRKKTMSNRPTGWCLRSLSRR